MSLLPGDMDRMMRQTAPWSEVLGELVKTCSYRPGWRVELHAAYERDIGCIGTTLIITTKTINSYPPHDPVRVHHIFPVPPATYDERSWRRWLFEQFLLVERHECAEFFEIDGAKPYAPSHGPGNDPYLIREVGTDIDVRTSFRGELNE